ncbi:MAG: DGQHR domain-containing protein [Methanomassiliicoccus sp.]|nr:DGQHR domain-containing protein [Methanomassiliicoccus sp.]
MLEAERRKVEKTFIETFVAMGFKNLATKGKHFVIGSQRGEIDLTFIFQNIILVCEETQQSDLDNIKDHLRTKVVFWKEIKANKPAFIHWIKTTFTNDFRDMTNYPTDRYRIIFLYYTRKELPDEIQSHEQFNFIQYIDEKTISYLEKMSAVIHHSARNELFKFLKLNFSDIGAPVSNRVSIHPIEAAVILPEGASGFPDGVKIVTFLMSAEDIMHCAYVMRKGSWYDQMRVYQRLLVPKKIREMRTFILTNERSFIDNIIVALPEGVEFHNSNTNELVRLEQLHDIDTVTIHIPKQINSIAIVDGQHRIYAHYEGDPSDPDERKIAEIRHTRQVLVTGLVFATGISSSKKFEIQSDLFLQINSTQKKAEKSHLDFINAMREPFSRVGVARRVLTNLNSKGLFADKFALDTDDHGIKTAMIIEHGLKDLAEIKDASDSLYHYWDFENKQILMGVDSNEKDEVLEKYTAFCSKQIENYFRAIKAVFDDEWKFDGSTKLLRVTEIVGFLKAFRTFLREYQKVEEFAFYKERLERLRDTDLDFTQQYPRYPYASSQWTKFGDFVSENCWYDSPRNRSDLTQPSTEEMRE